MRSPLEVAPQPPTAPPVTAGTAAPARPATAPEAKDRPVVAKPAKKKAVPTSPEGPRYLELERKECRFNDGQLSELNAITRRLNKARRGNGERITDNTLVRVAVDLLIARQAGLAGVTEEELRKSVGL